MTRDSFHNRDTPAAGPTAERDYLPAMGRHWLLPLYDPLTALVGLDRARAELLDTDPVFDRDARVLDVGCGTGKLAVSLARRGHLDVAAIDPDPRALSRAARRAARSQATVRFDRGFADALPYPDAAFDIVVSSLMFHHLDRRDKQAMLREVVRVLRSGGCLRLVDLVEEEKAGLARAAHAAGQLADNTIASVLELIGEAGLKEPALLGERTAARGHMRLACYGASRA